MRKRKEKERWERWLAGWLGTSGTTILTAGRQVPVRYRSSKQAATVGQGMLSLWECNAKQARV